MPRLSVIVPVYNVRETLGPCVESILAQRFDDYELLLIDDGSTDGSSLLARELAESDTRIHYYYKANGGLSSARNYGMERAVGEWLTFVDSDDLLSPDTLSPLMDSLEGADLVEYPVTICTPQGDTHTLALPDRRWPSARHYWHRLAVWEHAYAWNKCYRRSFVGPTRFPEGRNFEDLWFLADLLVRQPRVRTISAGCYLYRWNAQGITALAATDAAQLRQLLESQRHAAHQLRTTLLSPGGWRLYRSMLCRQIDIYRLSGEMLLPWPGVGLLCRLHQLLRHGGTRRTA